MSVDQFEQFQTNLNNLRQVWTDLDQFEQGQINFRQIYLQVWTSLDKFRQV